VKEWCLETTEKDTSVEYPILYGAACGSGGRGQRTPSGGVGGRPVTVTSHPLRRLPLLLQAWCLLFAAKIALRLIPVKRIVAWKQRPVRNLRQCSAEAVRVQAELVRWAVLACVRRSPISFVCFPQCLAGCALLRQRGIESRLHYGVTIVEGRLLTHTWLEAGGVVILGGEVADAFSTLAVY
jgi:hypothetical protein